MDESDAKADLHRYLRAVRSDLLEKLDGLSEYDVRRPLTPTGTNLLGLVKHLTGVELGYFGETFGRPFPQPPAWYTDDADPSVDMWANAQESRADVIGLYRAVCVHSDATVQDLPLDAPGQVPWWPAERARVTLHRILVHVVTETNRHAGHADLVRELIDGSAGLNAARPNLPDRDADGWAAYRDRVEQAARDAAGDPPNG